MTTITLDDMRSRLLSLDDVTATLATSEPLVRHDVTNATPVNFDLTPGWFEAEVPSPDTAVGAGTMTIAGQELPMTQEALLMAASNIGLSGAYVRRTPAELIAAHLNYWYNGNLSKEYSALDVAGNIAAFTKPSLVPFSNLELLDSVTSGIRNRFGSDTEVLVDYKFNHSLARTDLRLIIPASERSILNGGMSDVPSGEADLWCAGINLTNSLVGKKQTEIEAFMFRWWCTNGCITNLADVGTWNRRTDGQNSDVYVWAQEAVDEVLGGMEERFDAVQALTSLDVTGNAASVVREIFSEYEIPVSQRQPITDLLLDSENLTMYTVMNAITQVANVVDDPIRADRLMRIGGEVPTATFDTLKARIWAEGHFADEQARNPYAIRPVVIGELTA